MRMIEDVEGVYEKGSEFGDVLEDVLELYEPYLNEYYRECYKCTLGKIFGRRALLRQSNNRSHGRFAPFAPR